jgi:hypothetical protein
MGGRRPSHGARAALPPRIAVINFDVNIIVGGLRGKGLTGNISERQFDAQRRAGAGFARDTKDR